MSLPFVNIITLGWARRQILLATARSEMVKRYSGSLLGRGWIVIYPLLFLSIYVFVYLLVFKVRFSDNASDLHYVVYVFAGLVPFLAMSETMNNSVSSIKDNMHMVRNVILPIELIPIRCVLIAMTSQLVGLSLVLALAAKLGTLGPHLLMLPLIIALQFFFYVGLALILSVLGACLNDLAQMVGLLSSLLMFLSPIAFRPEMVPHWLGFMVYANPIFYVVEMFRDAIFWGRLPSLLEGGVFAAISFLTFAVGAFLFDRFKESLADYA